MTLKAMMKVLSDTRYLITALDTQIDEYETIEVDYINATDKRFSKAIAIRDNWMSRKNKVVWVHYNSAAKCVEVRVDLLG